MSGCRNLFINLNATSIGLVKFGDNSMVEVKGCGYVKLQGENGDQCILNNVLFIPKLQTNIVSLGQLDEQGCRMEIEHGSLVIYTKTKEVFASVRRTGNRLYLFNLNAISMMGEKSDSTRYENSNSNMFKNTYLKQ